jgi:hypothetical protein
MKGHDWFLRVIRGVEFTEISTYSAREPSGRGQSFRLRNGRTTTECVAWLKEHLHFTEDLYIEITCSDENTCGILGALEGIRALRSLRVFMDDIGVVGALVRLTECSPGLETLCVYTVFYRHGDLNDTFANAVRKSRSIQGIWGYYARPNEPNTLINLPVVLEAIKNRKMIAFQGGLFGTSAVRVFLERDGDCAIASGVLGFM